MAKKKFHNSDSMLGSKGRARMPESVIIKDYPTGSPYLDETLNDDISGIDNQMTKDVTVAKRHKSKNKF